MSSLNLGGPHFVYPSGRSAQWSDVVHCSVASVWRVGVVSKQLSFDIVYEVGKWNGTVVFFQAGEEQLCSCPHAFMQMPHSGREPRDREVLG